MRCVHPTCDSKSGTLPKDVAFHPIPPMPSTRALWLKLLNTDRSAVGEDGAVCSKHFLKADLYRDKTGVIRIRPASLPIVNFQNIIPDSSIVKICRICFATDRKLYKMMDYNNLDQAYTIVTGLSLENEDNLPPYLCSECAQRLLNCVHFRTRSLRAHLILLEVAKKHKSVSLQSLKAVIGVEGQLGSHLKIKEISDFDLVIKHDDDYNPEENTDVIDDIDVKMENSKEDSYVIHDLDVKIEENIISESKPHVHRYIVPDLVGQDIKSDSDDFLNEEGNEIISYSPTNYQFNDLEEEDDEDSDDEPITTESGDVVDMEKINKTKQAPPNSHFRKKFQSFRLLADKLIIKPGSAGAKATRKKTGPKALKLRKRPPQKSKLLYTTVNYVPSSSFKGKKPYSCRNCDFGTILKRDLTAHTKVCDVLRDTEKNFTNTSEDMPFKCNVCYKQFQYNYDLQVHKPLHTGKKPYKCDVCEKSFNFETSRDLHYRKFHTDEFANKRKIKGNK